MTAREEDRGIWLAPDWSGLAIEAEDGEIVEVGREHGDGAWVSQGMLDVVPDHWVRLVPMPDSETEWGCRDRHGRVHSAGVENEAQARAMRSMTPVRREVGPWTEVQP